MAVPGWTGRILVDGFDFSTKTSGFTIDFNAQGIEAPTLQNPATPMLADLPTTLITQTGYFQQPGAGELEQELTARLGVPGAKMAAVMGTELPVPVALVLDPCFASKLSIKAVAKELMTIDAAWANSDGLAYRGYQVFGGTISSTGAQAVVDFGAAAAAGGVAWFFLADWSGSGSGITIQVQSDSDPGMGGAATEGTFTMSLQNAYAIALTGTVGRYLRINVTNMGGFSLLVGVCIVALPGVTY